MCLRIVSKPLLTPEGNAISDPYDTAEAFSTLSELENAGYPVAG